MSLWMNFFSPSPKIVPLPKLEGLSYAFAMPDANKPLWSPSVELRKNCLLTQFASSYYGMDKLEDWSPSGYRQLHLKSVQDPDKFWRSVAEFTLGIRSLNSIYVPDLSSPILKADWFLGQKLNYAQSVLRFCKIHPDQVALYELFENPEWTKDSETTPRTLSFAELEAKVSQCAKSLQKAGVKKGDRIAAYLPNRSEAVIGWLATASLGAVWTSASPDFGVQGVLDRFGQIEPKVLLVTDRYWYNGTENSMSEKNQAICKALTSLELVVEVKAWAPFSASDKASNFKSWDEFLSESRASDIDFAMVEFSHPLMILFSSGTTGIPKCIVHSHGGTVLQHAKEHQLQSNVQAGDCLFYFSTLGWMMWNWLVTGLASGASLMLFDGSPLTGDGRALQRYAKKASCTHFGTSAKFIESSLKMNVNWNPIQDPMPRLRVVFSTGSPLSSEGFEYVYKNMKADVQLASISGGTDIVSCFVLGNPWSPVYSGEIQGPGLGMDVQVFSDEGQSIEGFDKGELVCATAFPSMPVGFWNDPGQEKYKGAYFDRFQIQGKSIWCHGDFIHKTAHGGYLILGRSDAVLNPGGVRIGTAEIYRQVEKVEEVLESLVIGQNWQNDVRVVLFVKLKSEFRLDDQLANKIKKTIRAHATPRHIPAKIIAVPEIPRTKSGKLLELAVRNIVHGWEVKNKEAMANPECLDYFKDLSELKN